MPFIHAPTGDPTSDLNMCPDGELNPQPFDAWEDALTNRATWPGPSGALILGLISIPYTLIHVFTTQCLFGVIVALGTRNLKRKDTVQAPSPMPCALIKTSDE